MSITPAPRTDAEWARNTEKRLAALENPQTARVGSWVLGDQAGALVATAPGQAPVTLSETAAPAVTRQITQVVAGATDPATTGDPVTQIINAILGGVGSLLDLQAWAKLVPLLTNPLELGGKLLDQVIPGFDISKIISGFIPSWLFGNVPSGSLTTAQPNRLRNGNFSTPDAILNPGDWTVDMSSSRTSDGSGSGRVVADGRPHALWTGANPLDKIPVSAGQNIMVMGYLQHTGAIVGTGGPAVLLQVAPFSGATGDVAQPLVTIDTYSPLTPDVPYPGHLITGMWPVPDGVTFVQGRVYVTDQALQGEYHGDDFDVHQMVDMNIIPGLSPALQALNNNWRTMMDGIASAARGFPVVGAEIADMVTALENFNIANIGGSLGHALLTGDIKGILGHLIDAVHGNPPGTTTDASLPDFYNSISQLAHNTAGQDVTTFAATTTLIPVDPTWANWIDALGVGRGQDGASGGQLPIPGLYGRGGNPGKFNATTWQKGTHYDNTLTGVQATFNTDGSVVLSIPGHSITCLPGSGTLGTQFGGGFAGKGPGPYPYNGKPYPGGGDQNNAGQNGIGPGGGGAGGTALFFQAPGKGGPAGAWVRARAADVSNPSTGADTTGPSSPTTREVVSATNSGLMLRIAGSVDA